jgi:hypothetical protein
VEKNADKKMSLAYIRKMMKEYDPQDGRGKQDLFFALAAMKFKNSKDGAPARTHPFLPSLLSSVFFTPSALSPPLHSLYAGLSLSASRSLCRSLSLCLSLSASLCLTLSASLTLSEGRAPAGEEALVASYQELKDDITAFFRGLDD